METNEFNSDELEIEVELEEEPEASDLDAAVGDDGSDPGSREASSPVPDSVPGTRSDAN